VYISHFLLVSAMLTALWETGRPKAAPESAPGTFFRPWDIFPPLPQDFSAFRPRDLGENGRTLQSGIQALVDGQPADQNTTVDGIFCYKQTTSVFLQLRHWRVTFDMLPPLILTNEENILSI
jgi:hypothetical protein